MAFLAPLHFGSKALLYWILKIMQTKKCHIKTVIFILNQWLDYNFATINYSKK